MAGAVCNFILSSQHEARGDSEVQIGRICHYWQRFLFMEGLVLNILTCVLRNGTLIDYFMSCTKNLSKR